VIQLVPVFQVDAVWPHLQKGMGIACKKGGGQYTAGWLHQICRNGEAYLVVDIEENAIRAGAVVQEQNWSGRVVLRVQAACGHSMKLWLTEMLKFGPEVLGVKNIVFDGRPGWGCRIPGVRVVRHVYEVAI
jgi:hypothetical protein